MIRSCRLVIHAALHSLALVPIVQLTAGLLGGALLVAAGQVISGLSGDQADWSATWPWIIALGTITTLSGVLTAVGTEQQRLISELVSMHTSQRLIDSAAAVPFSMFDDPDFYDQMRRATEGSRGSATTIVFGTLTSTRTLIDGAVVAAVLVVVAPVAIPIAAFAFVPIFLTSRRSNTVEHRFTRALTEDDRHRGYLATLFTNRAAAREVRMFDLGSWFGAAHNTLSEERCTRLRQVGRSRVFFAAVGASISSAMIAGALGLVAWMATGGDLSLADAGVGILGAHRLSGVVTRLNSTTASLHRCGPKMRDYDRFIAEAQQSQQEATGLDVPSSVTEIEVRDVSFRYLGATADALSGVSLKVRQGEITALVGPNGSGKSTLMMILCGLYTPTKGQVLWDGVDVATFHPVQLRSAIAPMFQDFTRYQMSALDNVAVSDLSAADDRARARTAIETAGAQPVVDRLHYGLTTKLSRAYVDGTELSAGQWQRLAIARALFHRGPLMVLDEPSADLDALAERALLDELAVRSVDRCVLFISHRFAAVRRADQIIVLSDAKLVEQGQHQTLLADAGLYAAMYNTQVGA